jgi:hypothetical protein
VTSVPNAARALLDPRKITAYLLSETHGDGKHKCEFFKRFGFAPDDPMHLVNALKAHPLDNEVAKALLTDFGMRYVVECSIQSPDGRNPCIVSVWQEGPDGNPAFITAYPKRV